MSAPKVMCKCEWCFEEFEHGYPGNHNSPNHRDMHLQIRAVRALEQLASLVDEILRQWMQRL